MVLAPATCPFPRYQFRSAAASSLGRKLSITFELFAKTAETTPSRDFQRFPYCVAQHIDITPSSWNQSICLLRPPFLTTTSIVCSSRTVDSALGAECPRIVSIRCFHRIFTSWTVCSSSGAFKALFPSTLNPVTSDAVNAERNGAMVVAPTPITG